MSNRLMKENLGVIAGQTKSLISLIIASGKTPKDIKAATDIDIKIVNLIEDPITMDSYVALWNYAVDVTGDKALALHLNQNVDPLQFGFVKHIVKYSKNLQDALQLWRNYSWMANSIHKTDWRKEGNEVILSFSISSPTHQLRYSIEYVMAAIVNYVCFLTGRDIRPKVVHFNYPEPKYKAEYKKIFKSKILFNQETNSIFFHKDVLLYPIKHHDPYMLSRLKQFADNNKNQKQRPITIKEKVIEQIVRL